MTQKVLDKGHPVCYTPYVKQKTFTNSGGQLEIIYIKVNSFFLLSQMKKLFSESQMRQ